MRIILFFLFLFAFTTTSVFAQEIDLINTEKRIILLKSESRESDWLQAQIKRLTTDRMALEERQALLLVLANDEIYDDQGRITNLSASQLITQYELLDFEGVVVIGKDGKIKLQQAFIVNPREIFSLIDNIPAIEVEQTDSKIID